MDYHECLVELVKINAGRFSPVQRKEKEMQFNIITYLKGRREYLKAQTALYASDTSKAKCAQARLSEICELLTILEGNNCYDRELFKEV